MTCSSSVTVVKVGVAGTSVVPQASLEQEVMVIIEVSVLVTVDSGAEVGAPEPAAPSEEADTGSTTSRVISTEVPSNSLIEAIKSSTSSLLTVSTCFNNLLLIAEVELAAGVSSMSTWNNKVPLPPYNKLAGISIILPAFSISLKNLVSPAKA